MSRRAHEFMRPGLRSGWMWLLFAGLVGAPLSSKLAGALWLGLCLVGAWVAVRRRDALDPALVAAAKGWLLASAVALVLAVVGCWIWRDGWDELHAGVRITLAAAAAVVLAGRLAKDNAWRVAVTQALSLACFAALGVACFQATSRQFPTNAIPWAVSMAFLVCLLLPRAFESEAPGVQRALAAGGVLAGVLAVLLSQSRGAYGIVVWVLGCCAWEAWRHRDAVAMRKWLAAVAIAVVSLVVVAALASASLAPRVQQAAHELTASLNPADAKQSANTSVGARMHLWQIGAASFAESPWVGIGGQERLRRIRDAGQKLDAPQLAGLGHMHNEYLQAAVDTGVIGLASVLVLVLGLLATALRVARVDRMAGCQLGGVLFMHATAGLTNVNTAHNYYGAMLATAVLLAFMMARASDQEVRA